MEALKLLNACMPIIFVILYCVLQQILNFIVSVACYFFSQMEGKIILSRLLSSFQVTLQEGYQLKLVQTTTLRPADYVPCKLVPLK